MKEALINPKVSIIIPVYNGEKYIRQAIDSALAQNYENLEILIVDDGSTDNTNKICNSYSDSRIRYIYKKNGGVSSALNLGVKEMTGDYFSWLSHDDLYLPNKIAEEIAFLRKHNYLGKKVIAFSDYRLIDKAGTITNIVRLNCDRIESKQEYVILEGKINGLSLLIPKSAFEECGFFRTDLTAIQDYELWWRFLKKYKFVHINKDLVSTRCHSKQVTATSPKVLTEGNEFYLKAIKSITRKRAEELEGSQYLFYAEMRKHFIQTIHTDVADYCTKEMGKIQSSSKKEAYKTLVSVVLPFFNRINETKRAIESVLSQTHQNFELILINDGSTDNIDPIRKLASSDKRISLINLGTNRGPSHARNQGISRAHGRYIAFLDSDDTFVKNKLERSLIYAISSNANFLYSSYYRRMEDNKEIIIPIDSLYGHCEREMIYSCRIATPTVLLKADWIRNNNLYFDESLSVGEDSILWLRCMKLGTFLVGIDEPLTTVYTSKKSSAFNTKSQIEGLKNIAKFLFSDDYYCNFNYEIAKLLAPLSNLIINDYELSDCFAPNGKIRKMVYFAKKEGLGSLCRRVITKLSKPSNKMED